MAFYTDTEHFTHTGSFYGVPVYLDLETDDGVPRIAGSNYITEKLFVAATWLHNYIISPSAQLLCAILNIDHDVGFKFKITGEFTKD